MFFENLRRKKALEQTRRLEAQHIPSQEEFLAEVHAAGDREKRLRSLLTDIRRLTDEPRRAPSRNMRKTVKRAKRPSRKRKSPSRK